MASQIIQEKNLISMPFWSQRTHGAKMWLLLFSWDVKQIFGLLVSQVYC